MFPEHLSFDKHFMWMIPGVGKGCDLLLMLDVASSIKLDGIAIHSLPFPGNMGFYVVSNGGL